MSTNEFVDRIIESELKLELGREHKSEEFLYNLLFNRRCGCLTDFKLNHASHNVFKEVKLGFGLD
jgi:hypothetical protein